MKDFTTIKKLDNGKYMITRVLEGEHDEADIKAQISSLEHSMEKAEDVIEDTSRRLSLLRAAMETGYAEGDTTMLPMKPV